MLSDINVNWIQMQLFQDSQQALGLGLTEDGKDTVTVHVILAQL
jgi:hypothetical protein